MLLESNNINFEPKLQNIRQIASKLFSSGEEPLVADFLNDTINDMDNSLAKHNEESDGSWKDIKQIFETFNKQTDAPRTSIPDQQQQIILTENKVQHSHNQPHYDKSFITQNVGGKINTVQTVQDFENREMNANKENIHGSIDQGTSASLSSQSSLQNSSCSVKGSEIETEAEAIQLQNKATSPSTQIIPITSFPNRFDDSKQVSSLNDNPNRVRQVNVEMFTVTLKRNDPQKRND